MNSLYEFKFIDIIKEMFYDKECIQNMIISELLITRSYLFSDEYIECYRKFYLQCNIDYKLPYNLPYYIFLKEYHIFDIYMLIHRIGYYEFLLYIFSYFVLDKYNLIPPPIPPEPSLKPPEPSLKPPRPSSTPSLPTNSDNFLIKKNMYNDDFKNIIHSIFYNNCISFSILLLKNPELISKKYIEFYKIFHTNYKEKFNLPDDICDSSLSINKISELIHKIGYYQFLLYIFSYFALEYYRTETYYNSLPKPSSKPSSNPSPKP